MAIIKLKDLVKGDCWVYHDRNAPDRRPAVTTNHDDPSPNDKPEAWDDYGLPTENDLENPESYFNCNKHREVELIEHFRVSGVPRPLRLERRALKPGDCFQYLDDGDDGQSPGPPHIVNAPHVSLMGMPGNWLASSDGSARLRMGAPVRRYPHWRKPFIANPPEPVVLPCVDPFKDLRDAIFVLEEMHMDGIKGTECFWRFERAQQTETLACTRMPIGPDEPRPMVCTNAECSLTTKQVEHARDIWALKLRLKVEVKAAEDVERERTRVVCDYADEL